MEATDLVPYRPLSIDDVTSIFELLVLNTSHQDIALPSLGSDTNADDLPIDDLPSLDRHTNAGDLPIDVWSRILVLVRRSFITPPPSPVRDLKVPDAPPRLNRKRKAELPPGCMLKFPCWGRDASEDDDDKLFMSCLSEQFKKE